MPTRKENQSRSHPGLRPHGKQTAAGGEFSFKKTNAPRIKENFNESKIAAGKTERADESSFAFPNREAEAAKTRELSNGAAAAREIAPVADNAKVTEDIAESIKVLPETAAALENSIFDAPRPAPAKKDKRPDNWLQRRGHSITYALLFLFTFVLYFRPYELAPSLAGLSQVALYLAVGTILIFVPSQLASEGTLSARPAEINYVLLLTVFGLISILIARSPAIALDAFYEPFVKVVLMFVVMINVVRTEARLKGLIWLALGVGVMLALSVLDNYTSGKFNVEDYRAMADIKGMFGNPNAQALHFVIVTPIAVALGFAAKNLVARLIYFGLAVLFVAGTVVTFSRGGFLGLIVVAVVLAWKLGRENRFQVMLVCAVIGLIFIALAPGNYGVRILSIFVPGLDSVGSSNQRSDLLRTSIIVTLRNPWGIGMMNFPLANAPGLVTHNSYTQVSSEMGVLALIVYLFLNVIPLRKLANIERELLASKTRSWIYYLAVGLQASLAGWMVGSFFDSAAYQWFLYYLVAYAVCLRRVYQEVQIPKSELQGYAT